MTHDHERLDSAMNDRRIDMGLDWKELAAAAGVADVTLRNIRKGRQAPSELNKRRLESALGWPRGAIDAVLAGGAAPSAADEEAAHPASGARSDADLLGIIGRLEHEIAELRQYLEGGEQGQDGDQRSA